MNQIATITSKRQLTIPSHLFKKAKFSEGDKVLVEEINGELRIKKMRDLVEELAGSVQVPPHLRGIDIDKAIELAKIKYFSEKFNKEINKGKK